MLPASVRTALAAIGLFATPSVAVAVPNPGPAALDVHQDPRLATQVRLESRGIPVSRVLARVERATGLELSASGRVGDERLVAFVPGSPVKDVLERVADLYRVRWVRERRGDRYRYRLEKPAAWAQEEQALRLRALREVLAQLARSLRQPDQVAEGKAGRPQVWKPLYPEVLPFLAAREPELLREGYLYLSVTSLPELDRERILSRLAPILRAQDAARTAALRSIREDEIARGIPPEWATMDKPPSRPERSTVTVELYLDRAPRASAGLRTDTETWYFWTSAHGNDLRKEGAAFYADRSPRFPVPGKAGTPQTTAAADDPYNRALDFGTASSPAKDWIEGLGRLSRVSGTAIYTDCYHYFNHGGPGHPRKGFSVGGRLTLAEALDRLCLAGDSSGKAASVSDSFWWRKGDSALVRSGAWLWDSATVLPADLIERLAESLRARKTLGEDDLPALAALDLFQVQSLGPMAAHMDYWHRGFRVPARLTPNSRRLLVTSGVEWGQLAPAERELAARLLPIAPEAASPGLKARIKSEIRSDPAQGAPVLVLNVWPFGERGGRPVHLPLAGYSAPPTLALTGLEVEITRSR